MRVLPLRHLRAIAQERTSIAGSVRAQTSPRGAAMPTQTPPTQTPADDGRGSSESFGQGQSGYAAGRIEADPSLQQESRNASYPDRRDEHPQQLGVDDRFAGAGSAPWTPEASPPGEAGDDVAEKPTSDSEPDLT
jgi:hypothetical protein